MKRYITSAELDFFLKRKIVLIMGPRQVGKTTLAKSLTNDFSYYNYDIKSDLNVFLKQEWDRSSSLVIFDEIHKMKKWKLWLKGIYDEGALKKQQILVTGSARLDVAKKMGDSLAGRFFSFRLNPLDLKELKSHGSLTENYRKIIVTGGFPEPFLEGSEKYSNIWRKTHMDLILRQDMLTLEKIRDIDGIENLVEMLAQRVGSTVSIHSLAQDLDRDDKTIKKWITALEDLYVIFRVGSKARNIGRGLKKSSKYYFYDLGRIVGDEGAKLENLVALSLKKQLEFDEDTEGVKFNLSFVKTKDDKEIDFLIEQKNKKPLLVEVKLSDAQVSRNFQLFERFLPEVRCVQLVKNLDREYSNSAGIQVKSALAFLESLTLNNSSKG